MNPLSRAKDMTGKRFGRLVAVCAVEKRVRGILVWNCRCDCGQVAEVPGPYLRCGSTKSCGCIASERMTRLNYRHGKRYTPEYRAWRSMMERCNNADHPAYHNYGGRGIVVCDEWRSFISFFNDVGKRPSDSHSLDRINNNCGYYKGNVRWATKSEQAMNRRERTRNKVGQFAKNKSKTRSSACLGPAEI